jgi:hypothetical protein
VHNKPYFSVWTATMLLAATWGCGMDGPAPTDNKRAEARSEPTSSPNRPPSAAPQNPAPQNTVPQPSAGVVNYEPGVSEDRFNKYYNALDQAAQAAITDEQVFAIMGEPTRRDSPVTIQRNGQTFTVYKAYWAVPGSGIQSQIAFGNGHIAGMILQGANPPRRAAAGEKAAWAISLVCRHANPAKRPVRHGRHIDIPRMDAAMLFTQSS